MTSKHEEIQVSASWLRKPLLMAIGERHTRPDPAVASQQCADVFCLRGTPYALALKPRKSYSPLIFVRKN